MTIDFARYKETHKSPEQRELEDRQKAAERAGEDLDHYARQGVLKYGNKKASPEEGREAMAGLLKMMGKAAAARQALDGQENKENVPDKNDLGQKTGIKEFKKKTATP